MRGSRPPRLYCICLKNRTKRGTIERKKKVEFWAIKPHLIFHSLFPRVIIDTNMPLLVLSTIFWCGCITLLFEANLVPSFWKSQMMASVNMDACFFPDGHPQVQLLCHVCICVYTLRRF